MLPPTPPTLQSLNLMAIAPVLIVIGWACVVLLADLFVPPGRKHITAWLAALGLVAAFAVAIAQLGIERQAFGGMLIVDGYAAFLNLVVLLAALIGVLISLEYLPEAGIERGEYYALLLFTTSGMMLMASAADLIVVFLALELLSIPLYVLAGFARPLLASEESAMKYFLLGAFASGFLLYGIALTYGATRTTALDGVVAVLQDPSTTSPLALLGMGLIVVGLGFKVAAVPFHMWTPDVYHGAPTPVTGFMSVGAKVGGFAAMLRVLLGAFPALAVEWGVVIQVIAGLTMILGNVVAISQTNVKRMLAYSSIAHAGYILMAVAASAVSPQASSGLASATELIGTSAARAGVSAALFYLLAYAFTNLGAFAVVIALEREHTTGPSLDDFAGLGKARPILALAMALFMLSLTGVPPSAGMVGKFFLFQAAINSGLIALAIVAGVTTLISAFYYLRVVVIMYMREGEAQVTLGPALTAALAVTALGTLALGIVPTPLFNLARASLMALLVG
jgi:NADH-quinone oxidoreductase subunit N